MGNEILYQKETRVFKKNLETLQGGPSPGSCTVHETGHLFGAKEKWGCNVSAFRGEEVLCFVLVSGRAMWSVSCTPAWMRPPFRAVLQASLLISHPLGGGAPCAAGGALLDGGTQGSYHNQRTKAASAHLVLKKQPGPFHPRVLPHRKGKAGLRPSLGRLWAATGESLHGHPCGGGGGSPEDTAPRQQRSCAYLSSCAMAAICSTRSWCAARSLSKASCFRSRARSSVSVADS